MTNEMLLIGLNEDERKDLYYHSGMNRSHYDSCVRDNAVDYMNDIARNSAVTVNRDLPVVVGKSEKQVKYAEDVRSKRLISILNDICRRVPETKEGVDMYIAEAAKMGYTAENRSDVINILFDMTLAKSKAYEGLMSTDAREILDKFAY